ncbi:MAG: hypothetical protein ACRDL7_14320, partial [Gaiellaceae bacterium]
PQDWTTNLIVPEDFTEEVERAGRDGHAGDLEMLAAEIEGFDWQVEGLRKVARKLLGLKAWESARNAWQKVAALKEGDGEAEALLPTLVAPAKLDELDMRPGAAASPPTYARVLLFTGHMIDKPGRTPPRFPPEMEDVARRAIRNAVIAEIELARTAAEHQGTPADAPILAIAGGACGGDILFHEVCDALPPDSHIETHVHLALPRDQFIVASVQHAGPAWVDRFNALCDRVQPRVLANSEELPRWLRKKKGYTIWSRNNLWTLHNALVHGGSKVTLIALWDGGTGDGPGGTEDMVQQARARGAKIIHLNTKELFGL